MAIWAVAILTVASMGLSYYQNQKGIEATEKSEKQAIKRAEASKARDQEMAKRQLRQAAIELGRKQLEVAAAKRKRVGAMHEAQASSSNVAVASAKPSARPTGRPVVG